MNWAHNAWCRRSIGLALLMALSMAPRPAAAELQRLSGAALTGIGGPIANLDDIAFDDKHNVYFHVWGIGPRVYGRFVDTNGNVIGDRILISTVDRAFGQGPRVAYSTGTADDVFFVVFSSDANGGKAKNVFGQLVRFTGSGAEAVGGNFGVSQGSMNPGWIQTAGGVVYNSTTRQFFVTWEDSRGAYDVFGRIFNADGTAATGDIDISDAPFWQGAPNVAWDWHANRYLVTWQGEHPSSSVILGSWAKVLDGATGTLLTGLIELSRGGHQAEENVIYLPERQAFLVCWTDIQRTGSMVAGRVVDSNGALLTGVYPVVNTPAFEGAPDGDYNPNTRTVMVGTIHDSAYVIGAELDGQGQPLSVFRASSSVPAARGGSFYPRVAAGSGTQFALGYILDYVQTWVERFQGVAAATPGPTPLPVKPPPPSATIDFAAAPNGSWFFAEGATGGSTGYDTYYLLANEQPVPVTVRAYFSNESGYAIEKSFTVDPNARRTIRLADHVEAGSYSAVFQSTTPDTDIYAQRNILWGTGLEGSAGSAGVKQTSQTWYFAEGSRLQEYFRNYFLVFNPTQTAGTVTFRFAGDDGSGATLAQVDRSIAAQGRVSLDANTIAELANRNFSAIVTSTVPVVAERSMYWQGDFRGGTNSFGTTDDSSIWYFGEGAAASNFETYYTLLNPNSTSVTVTPTYLLSTGPRSPRSIVVGANSRATISLGAEVGLVGGAGATFTSSGGDIIVERSIYWGRNWVEGTNAMGVTAPATEWHLPDGGSVNGLETYVLIANPNGFAVTVNVTALRDDGLRIEQQHPVAANSRLTLFMNTFDTQLRGRTFSTVVKSTTTGGSVVAEIAVYLNAVPVDYWRTGSASFGIPR